MSETGKPPVLLVVVLSLLVVLPTHAQEDAPAIYQATPNFYNAIAAPGFRVSWQAEPTELTVDRDIRLTLTITNVQNPQRIRRPNLAELPSFRSRFREIEAIAAPDSAEDMPSNRVIYQYRLRPRSTEIRELPELPYVYYQAESRRLGTKYLDAIPLKVMPVPTPAVPPIPLEIPSSFQSLPSAGGRLTFGLQTWLGLGLLLTLLITAWVALWRWRYPHGRRLARLRRIRAVRRAWDQLEVCLRQPEPVARMAEILRQYLSERFAIVAVSTLPSDLEAALLASSFSPEKIAKLLALFRQFDAARFRPDGVNQQLLRDASHELIRTWEQEP